MSVEINWDELTFKFSETKSLFLSRGTLGGGYDDGELKPFGPIPFHPAAGVLHYGQGVFEGMKAQHAVDGKVVLFRPGENANRIYNGAKRLEMEPVPVDKFMHAVHAVVRDNVDYIPPMGKGSLYIRPVVWGTGPVLGLGPSQEYTFCVFVCPVGPYFKTGFKPTKMQVNIEFHRAAPRGIGAVKAIGNYSATIYPGRLAKEAGFAENIYLNAGNNRTVEEVGAANFFCVKDGELHSPKLTGSILPGITRDSILILAKEKLGARVHERDIDFEELPGMDEIFCSGTAAVITPIGSVAIEGKDHVINDFKVGEMTAKLYDLLTGIQTKTEEDPYGWVVEV